MAQDIQELVVIRYMAQVSQSGSKVSLAQSVAPSVQCFVRATQRSGRAGCCNYLLANGLLELLAGEGGEQGRLDETSSLPDPLAIQ
jgi:hypothetical protein